MKIHAKILLPAALVMLLLGAYLVLFWLPSVLDEDQRLHKELMNFRLAALGETLVAPLQLNDVSQIHSVLNRTRFANARLSEISLVDSYGNILFNSRNMPGAGQQRGELYEYVITYSGEDLATLSVRTVADDDLDDETKALLAQLVGGLLVALVIYIVAAAGISEFSIRRPLVRLSGAAYGLENGDYELTLPAHSNDEIGQLYRAFYSMREAMRASRGTWERYRMAMDAHCMVSVMDRDSRIVYANDKYREMSGYTVRELIGKNMWELTMQPERNEKAVPAGEHVPWSGETGFINRHGRVYWTRSTIVPVHDAEDGARLIHVQTDITEERLSEETARKSSERLNRLINSTPCMLYIRDPARGYSITYISDNIGDILGFDSQDLLTDPALWGRQVHPDDRWDPGLYRVEPGSAGDIHVAEYRFHCRDRRTVRLRDQYRAVADSAGSVIEIAGSLTPVPATEE